MCRAYFPCLLVNLLDRCCTYQVVCRLMAIIYPSTSEDFGDRGGPFGILFKKFNSSPPISEAYQHILVPHIIIIVTEFWLRPTLKSYIYICVCACICIYMYACLYLHVYIDDITTPYHCILSEWRAIVMTIKPQHPDPIFWRLQPLPIARCRLITHTRDCMPDPPPL